MGDVSRETPAVPEGVDDVFPGARLDQAKRYVGWLADAGTVRGLIGPREVPRIWERHVLNSAVLGRVVPEGVDVCDVGSGAGLPGIPLALARADLHVTLIEPLLRRCSFLSEVIEDLGLENQVEVVRGRAEEVRSRTFDVVTARAVAPMERLLGWCVPLMKPSGQLLAMKGSTAADEVAGAKKALKRLGCAPPEILTVDAEYLDQPTFVVRVVRDGRAR